MITEKILLKMNELTKLNQSDFIMVNLLSANQIMLITKNLQKKIE